MKLKLNEVRLAFPAVFEPKTVNGEGEPRFSAVFLIPADHPQLEEIRNTLKKAAQEKWGAKWEAVYTQLEKQLKLCLHDGDEKGDYEGFPGNFFLNAANKARPLVIDAHRNTLVQADGRPYAGCYVNAVVDIWAQDNNFGKRINASLSGVQFLRDGDAFAGGGVSNPTDFDDLSEGTDNNDLL